MFSIIIPALNEVNLINDTIKHIHSISGNQNYEIIVVDGNDSGNTINIITDPSINCLKSSKGRAIQMNTGDCLEYNRYHQD